MCQTRTDIPNGVLQVLDLWPYTSQRSIYDPPGQTKYVNRGEFTGAGLGSARPTTIAASAHATTYACYGAAAYFVDNIEDVSGGASLFFTAAQANVAANLLAVAVNAGAALDSTAIDVFLAAASAGSGLAVNTSTGSVADVLQICAGGSYLLAAGSAENAVVASMNNGGFVTGTYRTTADGMALASSFSSGNLASLVAATFDYSGTTGQAIVVYADDGTVYV
jgi:hypothetical protein